DDPALVRGLEAFRDLPRDRDRLVHRDRALREALREVLAVHELERETHDSVRLLEPVDRGDVRVVERGEELRLAAEARDAVAVLEGGGGKHVDRDAAVRPRVGRGEAPAPPAGAERSHDLVRADAPAGSERHRRPPRATTPSTPSTCKIVEESS